MNDDRDLDLRIGHEEIVLRRRYEVASIANDLLVAVWFVVGSVLFLSPDTARAGTWLFLVGSVQLMIRPAIRLSRRIHVQRVSGAPPESTGDF